MGMNTAKIDLHLHLDGSLHLPWAWRTAVKRGVVNPMCTFEEYYNTFHRRDFKSREEGMRRFDFPIDVMQTEEDLADAAYYLVRTLDEQGMLYAEIRFAPQQHTKCGLTQKEAVQAVCHGLEQASVDYPGVDTGLLCCMMHKGADAHVNEAENFETVEVVHALLSDRVLGLDLAGYENTGDFMLYAPLFERARQYGIPYTIHAGEMGDGSHVMDALHMKADRIGHGIDCVQQKEWLDAVVESQVPLEICVTSNTKYELNYAAHPVRQLLAAGAKVTLNSDNMSFARTSVAHEHDMLRSIGVSTEELWRCTWNALDAAFCSEARKKKLRRALEAAVVFDAGVGKRKKMG